MVVPAPILVSATVDRARRPPDVRCVVVMVLFDSTVLVFVKPAVMRVSGVDVNIWPRVRVVVIRASIGWFLISGVHVTTSASSREKAEGGSGESPKF
jgi:hypothetical protein